MSAKNLVRPVRIDVYRAFKLKMVDIRMAALKLDKPFVFMRRPVCFSPA